MTATAPLIAELLSVSETTVKRDLSKGQFSLKRLDQICAALGLTMNDLMQPAEGEELVTQLSEAQEIALISQPRYFVVTYLLVSAILAIRAWEFSEFKVSSWVRPL